MIERSLHRPNIGGKVPPNSGNAAHLSPGAAASTLDREARTRVYAASARQRAKTLL